MDDQVLLLRTNQYLAERVVFDGPRRIISELIGEPQLIGDLAEICMRVDRPGIKVPSAGFFGNAVHDPDAVLVSGRELAVFRFGVANGIDQDVRCLGGLDGRHHVVRTGVVFAVAEHQQGAPSAFFGQLLHHGVVNRIVKRRAQLPFLNGPNFRKVALALVEPSKAVQQFRPRLRKVAGQPQMVSKADKECPVPGAQDLFKKDFQIVAMLLVEVLLAVAEINDQAQRKRKVDTAGEKRDLLRNGVFEDFDIVFGKVFHQGPTGIARRKRDIDKVRVGTKDLGFLAENKAGQR